MNELLFISEALFLAGASLGLARMGKYALFAFFFLELLCANLFVLKPVPLFGFEVTAADVFAVGSIFTLICLQELFGKQEARKTLWMSLLFLALFTCFSLFHLAYSPSHSAYDAILTSSPRIIGASLLSAFIADRFDLFLYGRLSFPIAVRFLIATFISQFIDTAVFTALALSGQGFNLFDIIIFDYILKIIAIVIMAFFSPLIRHMRPHAI